MKEPVPPMPGTYTALWVGVMVALSLPSQFSEASGPFNLGYAIGIAIPFAAVGWVLAKATWPSYWRQKYRK